MTIQQIIKQAGGPSAFARKTGVPLRTVQAWKAGKRNPPDWLPKIIEFYLRSDKNVGSSPAQKEFLKLVQESERPRIKEELLKIMEKTRKLVCDECQINVIDQIIENVKK